MTHTPTPTTPDPAASPTDPAGPHYVVTGLAPTEQQLNVVAAVGGQLNPDTNLPLPGQSPRQRQLVAELLDRLAGQYGDSLGLAHREFIEGLLDEAVVRQHGRTVRAMRADAVALADSYERDARGVLAAATPSDAPVDLSNLRTAQQLATAAATLRTTHLRGAQA